MSKCQWPCLLICSSAACLAGKLSEVEYTQKHCYNHMHDLVRFIKPTVPRSSSSSTSWVHKSTLAHAVTQLRSPPLFSHLGGQLRQLTYRPATTLTIVTAVLAGATALPSVAGEHAALIWRCCPHHLSQTMHDQPYCYKEHLACGPRSATPVDVTSWSTASNSSLRIQTTQLTY